jgi:N-formylglutamate amidohydrolase
MHHDDATEPAAPAVPADASAPQPGTERFGDLAELEAEIRRRLRSNQRFLDRFLD